MHLCLYTEIMEMSGVKIRDTVGWKVRENSFWFMLVQGFELPGVKIHQMYDRNPVMINFSLSYCKGLNNVECTLHVCVYYDSGDVGTGVSNMYRALGLKSLIFAFIPTNVMNCL